MVSLKQNIKIAGVAAATAALSVLPIKAIAQNNERDQTAMSYGMNVSPNKKITIVPIDASYPSSEDYKNANGPKRKSRYIDMTTATDQAQYSEDEFNDMFNHGLIIKKGDLYIYNSDFLYDKYAAIVTANTTAKKFSMRVEFADQYTIVVAYEDDQFYHCILINEDNGQIIFSEKSTIRIGIGPTVVKTVKGEWKFGSGTGVRIMLYPNGEVMPISDERSNTGRTNESR